MDESKSKDRILKRAESSGRKDDQDEETILKRFRDYREKTLPLVKKYKKSRKLVDVDASKKIETVYKMLTKKVGLPYNPKDGKKKEKTS